eukprot:tig00001239_g7763.t1
MEPRPRPSRGPPRAAALHRTAPVALALLLLLLAGLSARGASGAGTVRVIRPSDSYFTNGVAGFVGSQLCIIWALVPPDGAMTLTALDDARKLVCPLEPDAPTADVTFDILLENVASGETVTLLAGYRPKAFVGGSDTPRYSLRYTFGAAPRLPPPFPFPPSSSPFPARPSSPVPPPLPRASSPVLLPLPALPRSADAAAAAYHRPPPPLPPPPPPSRAHESLPTWNPARLRIHETGTPSKGVNADVSGPIATVGLLGGVPDIGQWIWNNLPTDTLSPSHTVWGMDGVINNQKGTVVMRALRNTPPVVSDASFAFDFSGSDFELQLCGVEWTMKRTHRTIDGFGGLAFDVNLENAQVSGFTTGSLGSGDAGAIAWDFTWLVTPPFSLPAACGVWGSAASASQFSIYARIPGPEEYLSLFRADARWRAAMRDQRKRVKLADIVYPVPISFLGIASVSPRVVKAPTAPVTFSIQGKALSTTGLAADFTQLRILDVNVAVPNGLGAVSTTSITATLPAAAFTAPAPVPPYGSGYVVAGTASLKTVGHSEFPGGSGAGGGGLWVTFIPAGLTAGSAFWDRDWYFLETWEMPTSGATLGASDLDK